VKKINIAVIGLGRMGQFHLDVISKIKYAKIVCSLTTEKKNKYKDEILKKYKIKKNYSNIYKMLSNESIDVAFIQPSVQHVYKISKIIIKNKINCLIEKPPGLSLEEAKNLSYLIKKNKIIHAIGMQRRFYSNILSINKYKRQLGRLYSVSIEAPERFDEIKKKKKFIKKVLNKWFIANGIHMIDLMQYVIGSKHLKVNAISKKINEKINNSFNALITFQNGVTANYTSHWKTIGGWQIKIYFTKGLVNIDPIEKTQIKLNNGKVFDLKLSKIDYKFKQGLYLQNSCFLESCLKKSKIDKRIATIEDAISALKLIKKLKA
jgi:predicted dehydrogenase